MPMPDSGIHPGLVWRFGGAVTVAAQKSYRDDAVRRTCEVAKDAARVGSPHHLAYLAAFNRRKDWLEQRAACRSIAIAGRLETGIGEPGVFECQVALHPVTGLPRLAGSGLKGMLGRWTFDHYDRLAASDPAAAEAGMPRDALLALFGSRPGERPMQAGRLTVHDAWWDPASRQGPLVPERVTPHHSDYYAGKPGAEATDFDSPNPVPRIAVAGTMHFAIDHDGIGRDWAELCLEWLHRALADDGAGAARQLGYGRFVKTVDPG